MKASPSPGKNIEKEIAISVVVISYNCETYIRQCLDSILMQKISVPMEILVSDDASTDGTPDILKEYQKKFPDLIHLFLRNENVGATRNSYDTQKEAKGKYMAFCEGDDYWCDAKKLQIQYDFMESHPQYIGCSHKVCLVDADGKRKKSQKLYWVKDKKVFRRKDFKGIFLPGQVSSIFRKNVFLMGLGEEFSVLYKLDRNIGDRTATLFYLLLGDFFQIDRVMSCYRYVVDETASNLTSKNYVADKNSIEKDFEYTKALGKWAHENGVLDVDFDFHKWELLLHVWRHSKEDTSVLKSEIYGDILNKMSFLNILKIFLRKRGMK